MTFLRISSVVFQNNILLHWSTLASWSMQMLLEHHDQTSTILKYDILEIS